MRKIAHRGASGYAPENTMKAFQLGIDMGADGLEFDVHVSADGLLVVIHDETLERTTNGTGLVTHYSADALAALGVPTLREVLTAFAAQHVCFIEIKTEAAALTSAELVAEFMASGVSNTHMPIISFHQEWLEKIHSAYPEILLGSTPPYDTQLDNNFSALAKRAGMWSVNPCIDLLSAEFVAEARNHDLKIITWTANTKAQIAKAKILGVDYIIGDFPDRL